MYIIHILLYHILYSFTCIVVSKYYRWPVITINTLAIIIPGISYNLLYTKEVMSHSRKLSDIITNYNFQIQCESKVHLHIAKFINPTERHLLFDKSECVVALGQSSFKLTKLKST